MEDHNILNDIFQIAKPQCPIDMLSFEAKDKSYWQDLVSTDRYGMLRNTYVENVGYPILTTETLQQLVNICKSKSVVDIGCGTGFISANLDAAGIDVTAIDSFDPMCFSTWRPIPAVKQAYAENIDLNAYDIILLSWPDYECDFGFDVIKSLHSGKTLIYQGEWVGGCVADAKFFHYLQHNYVKRQFETEALNAGHITWKLIRDSWNVFTKL